MDHIYSNTIEDVYTPGRHLSLEKRGMIQALYRQGLSLRDIAAAVGCAHTTVFYELRRGTPDRKSKHGRAHQLDGGMSPLGTLVTGCLRWLCQAKQAIYARTDSLYQGALQHAVG